MQHIWKPVHLAPGEFQVGDSQQWKCDNCGMECRTPSTEEVPQDDWLFEEIESMTCNGVLIEKVHDS